MDCEIIYWTQYNITNSVFHLFAFHNPTLIEIYDFSIGDIYESHINNEYSGSATRDTYNSDSILSKTATPYSISYTGTEHSMSVFNFPPTPPAITYSDGVYSLTADTTLLVNPQSLPEEWNAGYLLHYFPHYTVLCDSPASYKIDNDNKGTGFGEYGNGIIPSYSYKTYSIGYGISDEDNFYAPALTDQSQSYSYYNKNGIQCGTFIQTDKVATLSAGLNNIRILPNPASDHVDIVSTDQLSKNTFISVYDISGRCVFRTDAELQNKLTINTSSWTDGLYMMVIVDNNGLSDKEKMVITH